MIERRWTFPAGARIDVVLPDGTHRYWSTHCRHAPLPRRKRDQDDPDGHDACTATELVPGVPRQPAQCKGCGSPCVCPCHGADKDAERPLSGVRVSEMTDAEIRRFVREASERDDPRRST